MPDAKPNNPDNEQSEEGAPANHNKEPVKVLKQPLAGQEARSDSERIIVGSAHGHNVVLIHPISQDLLVVWGMQLIFQ